MVNHPERVVLIVVDTLRADHLGCYGYFRNTSPTIDMLAKGGVLFPDAHATAIATGPAFTSIMTGLYPIHHECYCTPFNIPNLFSIDDEIRTFPEQVWESGYTTCAFDGLFSFASPMKQMVRGFEYYINYCFTAKMKTNEPKRRQSAHGFLGHFPAETPGGVINQRLLPWIKEHKDERFFLFVHYWDPHAPYNQPQEYRSIFHHRKGDLSDLEVRRAKAGYEYVSGWGKVGELWEKDSPLSIDLYDGGIRYVDSIIREVIEGLKEHGIIEDSIIILTSDHGEQLGQHGIYGHGGLHEAVSQIPLIIYGPAIIPSGKKILGYVQHVDIGPTILDLIGVKSESPADGISLVPIIEGKGEARQEIFLEDEEERAFIQGKWKYIYDYESEREALYDVEEDPMEILNLAQKERDLKEKMKETLDNWVKANLLGAEDPLIREIAKWRSHWREHLGYDFPRNEIPRL